MFALVVIGMGSGRAEAAVIRAHRQIVVTSETSLGGAWARFLEGGPALWEVRKPPRFPSGLVLPTSEGRLVETPFVDYLSWRRDLDPTRFDFYHPRVGPELAQLLGPPASTVAAHRPVPGGTSVGGGRPPFHPQPQNLPEPGMLPVALLLLGAGLTWRYRARGTRDNDR